MIVRAVISGLVLAIAAGLFFVNPTTAGTNEATAVVALVLGYWLREGDNQLTKPS